MMTWTSYAARGNYGLVDSRPDRTYTKMGQPTGAIQIRTFGGNCGSRRSSKTVIKDAKASNLLKSRIKGQVASNNLASEGA